ncbi:MAG: alkaline phosphatase, partial [Candidatus Kariarchaeaceae archaeon]
MHLRSTIFFNILLISTLLLVSGSFPPQITSNSKITPNKEVKAMPNVIFLIGDGMGPEMVKGASLVEYGSPYASIMDTDFPIQQLYNTNNIDNEITDSSAAASAIATGVLTRNE